MDLRRFEFLHRIADHGSFSKAASVIGITQPALGRQIRKLEEDCGAVLLYRNGRGASLTTEGVQLLTRVSPLLKRINAEIAELQSGRKAVRGAVSVGMTPALSRIIGFPLLTAVRREHPQIALNIITGYSGYLLEWLTSGRIDVGILDNARRAEHLIFDPLAEIRLSLVSACTEVPASARKRRSVKLADLAGLPLVLPTQSHGLRRALDLAATNAGIRLNVAYEVDAHYLVQEIVLAGTAHTIMAARAVRQEIERGQLLTRLLNPCISTRYLCGTSSNRPVTAAIRAVRKTLEQVLTDIAQDHSFDTSIALDIAARR